jgi:hypothetical protein
MRDPLELALEDLRASLCRGDYADLTELSQKIESMMMGVSAADADRLRRLKPQAEATASCVAAARAGLQSARRRLAEVAAIRAGLGTYDRAGTRLSLGAESAAARRL